MSRNFTPEQTLIDRLLADDTAAFEELSRRYCGSLYTYCMSKLNSSEDSKRIVRNIFIALWENRQFLPLNFSLSLHLYTEVRRSVVQCINNKLNKAPDISVIEEGIITGFEISEFQQAKQPARINYTKKPSDQYSPVTNRKNEEQGWNKFFPAAAFKGLKHVFQNMLNCDN